MLSTRPRRIIALIIVIFIGYAIITQPAVAAVRTREIWNIIVGAVTAIFAFFTALISG